MIVFGLFVFVTMLMVGGLAVDVMRHENERLRMQDTADRAALAAALRRDPDDEEEWTPQELAAAYFTAAGLGDQLGSRTDVVESDDVGRTVTVAPGGRMNALFSGLIGIEDLDMVAPATAEHAESAIQHIELVMVLDVSGSMNGQGKIGAMRNAAADLVETMLNGAERDDVGITLVPYDSWVLPPNGFLDDFTNVTGNGACSDFTQWNEIRNSRWASQRRQSCPTDPWAMIRPYQNNVSSAQNHINSLRARGTTSIDLGLRYGALFFDPSIRPAIESQIAQGNVSTDFTGRPFDWEEDGVIRALILLTDGQNCCGQRGATSQMDQNTVDVCTELKKLDVLVYAISYQAPASGAAMMQQCASSPNHYFETSGLDIMTVFDSIAANIQSQAVRLIR
ncbi:MAG: pilus assembly protein TadG-related protein [Paracoccaceae bacterium]